MRHEGHITDDELVDFLLDIVDDDQIQDRFQSFMDDMGYFKDLDEDETAICPQCGATDTDTTTIADHGMCRDCLEKWQYGESDEDEEADFAYAFNKEALTYRIVWLRKSDFDYDWRADQRIPAVRPVAKELYPMTENKPMSSFEITADASRVHVLMGGPGVGRFVQDLIDLGAGRIEITLLTPEREAELMQQARHESKGTLPHGS
jgi:hypothetical protein